MATRPSPGSGAGLAFPAALRRTALLSSPHHGPRRLVIVIVYRFPLKGKGLVEVPEWAACPHPACAPRYAVLSLAHGGGGYAGTAG